MSAPSLATRALRGLLWNGGASAIQLGIMLALYALMPIEKLGHFEWALMLAMLLAGPLVAGGARQTCRTSGSERRGMGVGGVLLTALSAARVSLD